MIRFMQTYNKYEIIYFFYSENSQKILQICITFNS